MNGENREVGKMKMGGMKLDCYPYTFSPLLLFAPGHYFDKGFSNYNAVARFFAPILDVDMEANVLFERKNMLYEELIEFVASNEMLVTCCIDSHFTAFKVIGPRTLIYYDPLDSNLHLVTGDSFTKLVAYLLLKCNYGDNQHIQDNKGYYTGHDANSTRRMLYKLWNKINKLSVRSIGVSFDKISLNLDQYLLINRSGNNTQMSTQLTGNTCYFQTYLFAILCKAGKPIRSGSHIDLQNVHKLAQVTVTICQFLLEFFVQEKDNILRPLTNSNFVLDFKRYEDSPYYFAVTKYLQHLNIKVPDYELQYKTVHDYYVKTKTLHNYSKFTLTGAMSSTLNTKSLQPVTGTEDAVYKLATGNYYKYRAANLMFGFNSGIMKNLMSFCEFNSWRKNQLLSFYQQLGSLGIDTAIQSKVTKYRDYYFIPQFEVGQKELVDIHLYTYLIDMCSINKSAAGQYERALVERINKFLVDYIYFSTQKKANYQNMMPLKDFKASKKYYGTFLKSFMSIPFLNEYVGLGFSEINPREKEINSLTQTVFYSADMMRMQTYTMAREFEKECINEMGRSTLRKYQGRLEGGSLDMEKKYRVSIKIGHGYTYSKYNTLMHFLNTLECYWQNPDLSNVEVFGKDIRALLAVSCQKLFFEPGHSYYHYGPFEQSSGYRDEMDLAVGTSVGHVLPSVCQECYSDTNVLVLTDRVYEFDYLQNILKNMFTRLKGIRIKTDNPVLNLQLLSLMLDFQLYDEFASLLNLPSITPRGMTDKRQLQVEVANIIQNFDKKNTTDAVTRIKLEQLIFESSYKFIINKNFSVHSRQNQLIQELNCDPIYQQHILLCKINMSLCQINKSVEVDYYKIRCNGKFTTIIPHNFSKTIGEYLEEVTKQYTFEESEKGYILYDELPLFDLRTNQPEINLYKVRFDSATDVQSMVKYVEIKNAFQASVSSDSQRYLVFIANNALHVDVSKNGHATIRINKIDIEVATIFFNEAISFIPCFKYVDSEDVIMFTSRNIHYLVDKGGQFATDYYGMKHELIECINSDEVFVDLNDEHVFKQFKLSELLTESKTVVYFPDYLLQVSSRQQLINLLDFALYVRNISFFILTLFYLRRCSVALHFKAKENDMVKITGPWKEAILYVLDRTENAHYESVFKRQFFDLNQHENLPLGDFIDVLCENFTRYQRFVDGQYQIVPREKQKAFLKRIICAEECFHFSEVGSGKTKVILPLLCQTFLSSNKEAHRYLARGGKLKHVLVVLVPEHLVSDAKTQVFRYCLNLNFREEYRVYDDIFALLHEDVQLGEDSGYTRSSSKRAKVSPMKQIFVTSFNQFKKALTYDKICEKMWAHRESVLVITDEVDDFLDRDKLVFNICSNKGNSFSRSTLEYYFEVSRSVYCSKNSLELNVDSSDNPEYWTQLREKFAAIHTEIQDTSKSVNKSFGIFNEQTLRHSSTNIARDIEGYKSLIARPYESVNRAMPGSYYSDVERTIYLTFVILMEDTGKYDEIFQQERKFITFEYWEKYVSQLDYDDLVYGSESLSELVDKFPDTKLGLIRFLYEIILRRMEIRDKSRSVNSIDVVFNFDCIGFTGTPFIDNYPTFAYIRGQRKDDIPNNIDRSFYAYTSDKLSTAEFEERFARFQGHNNNVCVEYVNSDFIQSTALKGEMAILEHVIEREDASQDVCFNVLVDLCGIFKRSSIYDVRDLILNHFGPDFFHYIYHIDQTDGSDRVLHINSDNDVQFDEEFYKSLCNTYGSALREKIFFFVDNRNVIGKDIPFQLIYRKQFDQPLFIKSVVLAHDVEDFSHIWQAMGRSRTMNDTVFSIYKSDIPDDETVSGPQDIKKQELTRQLYIRNCDRKMAGNMSSIYQTLLSLYNLAQGSFYYKNEIVNVFLDKMEMTITSKVRRHEQYLSHEILESTVPQRILGHILSDKFKRSTIPAVAGESLTDQVIEQVLKHVVWQKFEQRDPSGDIYDDFIRFLSGEQQSVMEISYTKQQQKQKQKQKAKNQDSDTMETFQKKNQLDISVETENYFEYTLNPSADVPKTVLNLPLSLPVLSLSYSLGGLKRTISVYPTLQFLYSHHIQAEYISNEVRETTRSYNHSNSADFVKRFLDIAKDNYNQSQGRVDTPLCIGQTVVLHGLTTAKYNGKRGQIVSVGDVEDKWGIALTSQDSLTEAERIHVHRENLKVVESMSGPGSPSDSDYPSSPRRRLASMESIDAMYQLDIKVFNSFIRQNPQYTLAAIQEGVYVIGMKDQFNIHDREYHPLKEHIQYVADEFGFILYDKTESKSVDTFGPYFIEQYILMEVLSKHEVAQNVMDYYVHHKEKLESALETYDERQGKGFICWRFLFQNRKTDTS